MERSRSEAEMAAIDVPQRLRDGLAGLLPDSAPALDPDSAVAAAIAADDLGVNPASLAYLAQIVRRGGRAYAAELTEPLPDAKQIPLARAWLKAAAEPPASFDADEAFARWLEGVAAIVAVRGRAARRPG